MLLQLCSHAVYRLLLVVERALQVFGEVHVAVQLLALLARACARYYNDNGYCQYGYHHDEEHRLSAFL